MNPQWGVPYAIEVDAGWQMPFTGLMCKRPPYGGIRAIDADLLKAARAFCASDWQIFKTVAIPGSVPFILTGVRQGVALGLIGVVVGEMYGGSQGVGYMVSYGGTTFHTDTVFVGVLIVAFSGIVLTALAEALERRFSRWRPER